ncbi:MAG: hypothetical protein AAB316_12685 [Bacteroidota bacterium]
MKKHLLKIAFLFFLCVAALNEAPAQCPMCKIAAESNLKSGGKAGSGLNTGILYMLSMPYLLVGTLGYLWWRNRRKVAGEDLPDDLPERNLN